MGRASCGKKDVEGHARSSEGTEHFRYAGVSICPVSTQKDNLKIFEPGTHAFIIEGGLDVLRRDRPRMIFEAHSRRLAAAGKSFQWYLDTFPDYHVLVIYAPSRANPYLRLEPLDPDQPEIAVNLLLLPRLGEPQGDRVETPGPIAVED